jgi:hypothetical protein
MHLRRGWPSLPTCVVVRPPGSPLKDSIVPRVFIYLFIFRDFESQNPFVSSTFNLPDAAHRLSKAAPNDSKQRDFADQLTVKLEK